MERIKYRLDSLEKVVRKLDKTSDLHEKGLFDTTQDIIKLANALKPICPLVPDPEGYCDPAEQFLSWEPQIGSGRRRRRRKRTRKKKKSKRRRRKRSRKKRRR